MTTATVKNAVVKPAVAAPEKAAIVKKAPAAKAAPAKIVSAKPVVAKPAVKPAAKPIAKPAAEVVEIAKVSVKKPLAVVEKAKKTKLVRDSFTIPEDEYTVLSELKKTLLAVGVEAKKSQLLRVGLVLLKKASEAELKKQLADLAPLKAGRPKKEK
jgi:hypothetical protein